jgi:endonuclease/exonuclease/phosphatase family metal-dependent hydrolase
MHRLLALSLFCLSMSAETAFGKPATGTLHVVTYNVAGLPEAISRSNPARNMPLIGDRLNRYDLALVQEDFAYGALLREKLRFPYQSRPFERGQRYDFGDALSVFARFPFREPERTAWTTCYGFTSHFFDCLAPKGFAVTTLALADGVALDIYDVHLDAGFSEGDRAAREAQLEQLAAAVHQRSSGRAVIVGGDFNLNAGERSKLSRFERATGLSDSCTALRCSQPARIDRVLFRASALVELTPVRWRVGPGFHELEGVPLSDHAPVAVEFSWRRRDGAARR